MDVFNKHLKVLGDRIPKNLLRVVAIAETRGVNDQRSGWYHPSFLFRKNGPQNVKLMKMITCISVKKLCNNSMIMRLFFKVLSICAFPLLIFQKKIHMDDATSQ